MQVGWKNNVIMYWGLNKISDHGRDPLQETYEILERKGRMVNGTLRRYVVAKKKAWATSWTNLPSHNNTAGAGTVDGGWSADQMEAFYRTQSNKPFVMTLRDGMGNQTTYTVILAEFEKEIVKRGVVDWCNVSVTLEEV
jgi:hypothetical protein